MTSNVHHPEHYNSGTAVCKKCNTQIECIDVVRECNFNIGNVIKYLWRASHKGSEIQDLEKALWYLNDEIARRKGQSTPKENITTIGFVGEPYERYSDSLKNFMQKKD